MQLVDQVVNRHEHEATAGVGGKPVMAAEAHCLVGQGRGAKFPAVEQNVAQRVVREVIGLGEHPDKLLHAGQVATRSQTKMRVSPGAIARPAPRSP